eukprot:1188087-Prorocentrum_minimum.AAC.1
MWPWPIRRTTSAGWGRAARPARFDQCRGMAVVQPTDKIAPARRVASTAMRPTCRPFGKMGFTYLGDDHRTGQIGQGV